MTTSTLLADLAYRSTTAHAESPRWDARTDELLWVDVHVGELHRWSPRTSLDRVLAVGEMLAAPAPGGPDGGFGMVTKDGFAYLSVAGGLKRLATPLAGVAGMRMNDGRPDALGRFWAGSIRTSAPFADGTLYVMDTDRQVRAVIGDVQMSNGLDWSPDGRTLYYIDSATGVNAYDFDMATGTVLNARLLIAIPASSNARPDGMAVDEDGGIWIAMYGGSEVLGYFPDGRLHTRITLPVRAPTAVAFGGPDLRDLYITTMRHPADPISGSVFVTSPGPAGQLTTSCTYRDLVS